jgi:hypothetical protein
MSSTQTEPIPILLIGGSGAQGRVIVPGTFLVSSMLAILTRLSC